MCSGFWFMNWFLLVVSIIWVCLYLFLLLFHYSVFMSLSCVALSMFSLVFWLFSQFVLVKCKWGNQHSCLYQSSLVSPSFILKGCFPCHVLALLPGLSQSLHNYIHLCVIALSVYTCTHHMYMCKFSVIQVMVGLGWRRRFTSPTSSLLKTNGEESQVFNP